MNDSPIIKKEIKSKKMKDKITIIGIAGGTGSGKTTVVKKIVESLLIIMTRRGLPLRSEKPSILTILMRSIGSY